MHLSICLSSQIFSLFLIDLLLFKITLSLRFFISEFQIPLLPYQFFPFMKKMKDFFFWVRWYILNLNYWTYKYEGREMQIRDIRTGLKGSILGSMPTQLNQTCWSRSNESPCLKKQDARPLKNDTWDQSLTSTHMNTHVHMYPHAPTYTWARTNTHTEREPLVVLCFRLTCRRSWWMHSAGKLSFGGWWNWTVNDWLPLESRKNQRRGSSPQRKGSLPQE